MLPALIEIKHSNKPEGRRSAGQRELDPRQESHFLHTCAASLAAHRQADRLSAEAHLSCQPGEPNRLTTIKPKPQNKEPT
jgi:hypothetical protein